LPFVRDFLAENLIPGADTIQNLAERSGDDSGEGQKSTNVSGKILGRGGAENSNFRPFIAGGL
jgi:hypothetical protein